MKGYLLLAMILLCSLNLAGQNRYSFSAGFGRQRIGMPFHDLLGFPPHTSLVMEVSRQYGNPDSGAFYQTAGLLTFDNSSAGSGYLLYTHFGGAIPLNKSISLKPEAGASLVHRFHPRPIYSMTQSGPVILRDPGKIKPALDIKTTLAYRTQQFSLFCSYQISAEFLYNESFPFIPINYLHLGASYHLKSKMP